MRRKQFLLTKKKGNYPHLDGVQKIGDYFLYLGKGSEYCFADKNDREFHLIGSLYDWETPSFSNQQILEEIAEKEILEEILEVSDKYFGQFILIIRINDEMYLFNDATSQKEVYYDADYSCFGTQINLLALCTKLEEHDDEKQINYYASEIFKKNHLFIGDTTHKKNIFHLLPNHYIDIKNKIKKRFFPLAKLEQNTVKFVASSVSQMLKGYIKAVAERGKIEMAVTAGYDSRVLFLASLDTICEYFIIKFKCMNDNYYDISISKKITDYYQKDFKIIHEDNQPVSIKNDVDKGELDFPSRNVTGFLINRTIINGNISEIGRNYFGYHKNATAKDLSFLTGNGKSALSVEIFEKWLEANKTAFKKQGYNYLDMFYWEEKMGNWCAKMKTETNALGVNVLSPFNSRGLLKLILSTNRKRRDSHYNKLYNSIIYELSGKDKEILKIPINPCTKQRIIRLMKILNIYNLYRHIGVKARLLKI